MTPWSVSPRAGWSSSAARAAIASILQAPSSSEYSLWAWRCTADAVLTRRRSCQAGQMATAPSVTLPRDLRAASELRDDQRAEDARGHGANTDEQQPLHRIEAGIDFSEAGSHLGFYLVEPLVNLFEALVD